MRKAPAMSLGISFEAIEDDLTVGGPIPPAAPRDGREETAVLL